LQQLLSAGNVQYTKDDVRNAMHEITSLTDLSMALDFLAVATLLEEQMDVKGSVFQREALTYCRGVLHTNVDRKGKHEPRSRTNPHVQLLSHKIEYHTQVGPRRKEMQMVLELHIHLQRKFLLITSW
jgi:hypothetical protein